MEESSDKILFLIDFDGTIVDGDIVNTMFEATLNKEELKYLFENEQMNYAQSMDKYFKLMKSKGKNVNENNPILETMKFNDGIEDLFNYIKENKNKFFVILLKDDDLYTTSYYLKYKKCYDIFDYFIGIPASIDEKNNHQMIEIQFLPPHTCDFCDKSLCKTNEFLKFLDKNKIYKNSKIFYICDGWNDFCLSKNYLTDKDYIMARKGFSFWKLMQKEKYNKEIKSQVFYWNFGQEIIDFIKNNSD